MVRRIRNSVRGVDLVGLDDELLCSRKIFLTDEISADTTNEVIKQLMCLYNDDPDKEITLYINSPGGEVTSGLAVYDYLSAINTPIRTVCIGLAASMGAILFLAGDKREMLPHTRLMIHDPCFGHAEMGGKKPHEIKHELDKLNETREIIVKIIAEKTGKSEKEIKKVTADDTYYTSGEAVEFGLATGIIEKGEAI